MAMTKDQARDIVARYKIDPDRDFHALPSSQVDAVLEAADGQSYRKPANANGSRARYFYAYLQRVAAGE